MPSLHTDHNPGPDLPLGERDPAPTHLGWYSRGHLPHLDAPELYQVITYRLADSLPSSQLMGLEAERDAVSHAEREARRRARIDAWLDAGHGSCALAIPAAADCVVDTWRRFHGERYDLVAWVVMPNHVHVLIRVFEGVALGKILQSWKSYTGRRIRALLVECRAGARRSQGGGVWMREYWDRYVRDEAHFIAAVDYIHANPVKAGLVARREDWRWSSVREYVPPWEEGAC